MKLNHKIEINLKDFFIKGKFDYIQLGQSKEWIVNNFPDPDGYSSQIETPKIYESNIWCYGNIEFHFHEELLFLIYSDDLYPLDGGDNLLLDKWFLGKATSISLKEVQSLLNAEHIDYCKQTSKYGIEVVTLVLLLSKVQLNFQLNEYEAESYADFEKRSKYTNQNHYKLRSFSLIKPKV